jgi:hypothetical protein
MLEYVRDRKKVKSYPVVWWPLAPFASLLTVAIVFLMVTPEKGPFVRFTLPWTMETDDADSPLAVLRMRPGRTATLFYFRSDKLQEHLAAEVSMDFAAIPARPLPEHLRRLGKKWILVDDDGPIAPSPQDHEPTPAVPGDKRLTMLVRKEYRPDFDWKAIRQGLLDAKAVGIESDLVYIEADDRASLEGIVGAADLCMALRLAPVLKMQ